MRTLTESILDGDLDMHDEAVFTDQIIPEISRHLLNDQRTLDRILSVKMENGKRILVANDKSVELDISGTLIQALEGYEIHEIRSEGPLTILTGMTNFNISAPRIDIHTRSKDMTFTKCNMACDTLSVSMSQFGKDFTRIICHFCQVKAKIYEIHRAPIEFSMSKIIGLNSVWILMQDAPIREQLFNLGLGYWKLNEFYTDPWFDKNAPKFDPLEEFTGIQKITKLPNLYLFPWEAAADEHKPLLIFKSPRIPIDKQIEKATNVTFGPVDCAKGYQLMLTGRVSIS